MQDNFSQQEEIDNKQIPKHSTSQGCFIAIATIIIVVVLTVLCLHFLIKRNATNADVIINKGETNLFSYSYTFIPQKDIDELQFEISFYDNNRKLISNITKSIGDVEKGKQYSVTINLTELSLSQVFSDYVSVRVSKGKIAIL